MNFAILMALFMCFIGFYSIIIGDEIGSLTSFTIASIWTAADWVVNRVRR